jgi:hypothetical protein
VDKQPEGTLTTADLAGQTPPVREEVPVGSAPGKPDTGSDPGAPVREEVRTAPEATDVGARESLFAPDEAGRFRDRWTDVQARFVDEPRRAVEEADGLVAETIKRLAEVFADERQRLESRWSGGGDASTEDLRQALRRYRSFFDRLLSV